MSEGPRNEFGLGEKIVLETVNVLKEFFFGNYLTSYKLMKKLSDNIILDTQTVRKNRISVRRKNFSYRNRKIESNKCQAIKL